MRTPPSDDLCALIKILLVRRIRRIPVEHIQAAKVLSDQNKLKRTSKGWVLTDTGLQYARAIGCLEHET
jgi:hypothetical protein